jgi:hypothetical protein
MNFLHVWDIFDGMGWDWAVMAFLKISFRSKERDENRQKINLAHAWSAAL